MLYPVYKKFVPPADELDGRCVSKTTIHHTGKMVIPFSFSEDGSHCAVMG